MRSRGLAPLGCLPLWGREGVTLAISTPAQKIRGDFYRADISFLVQIDRGAGNFGALSEVMNTLS